MSYFAAGGSLAGCPHPGVPQRSDLFTVNASGALCWLSADGAGKWSPPFPLTPAGFALPGAFVIAVPDFGGDVPGANVFLVDASGTLQLFNQSAPRSSWKNQTISDVGRFVPGTQTFAVLPGTLPNADLINQISVLIFDPNGTLCWYHREAGQGWTLDTSIQVPAAVNANLTGLIRVTADSQNAQDLRLFYVDSVGVLNTFTRGSAGWGPSVIPSGGVALAPFARLAASVRYGTAPDNNSLDDANVFAVDTQGRLVCYSLSMSGWNLTALATTSASPFAPVGAAVIAGRQYTPGVYRTIVCVVGNDKSLYVSSSEDGADWSKAMAIGANVANPGAILALTQQASAPSSNQPYQTDLIVFDLNNALNVFSAVDVDAWGRFAAEEPLDPKVGLLQGSEQVVFATGSSSVLTDLRVDILVTEDLVPTHQLDALGNPVGGLGIQLNLNGDPADTIDFEQYTFTLEPYNFEEPPGSASLNANVQCWQKGNGGDFIDMQTPSPQLMANLPSAMSPRIPAGYLMRIELSSTSSGEAVNEAKFYVFDSNGKQIKKLDIKLTKLELLGPGGTDLGHVPKSVLTRIVSLQLNIVGRANAERTQLRSGAGTITYSSKVSLIPSVAQGGTGENSNCIYSTISTAKSAAFVQRFQTAPLAPRAIVRKPQPFPNPK